MIPNKMNLVLADILGYRVRITNMLDIVTEGTIYTFNPNNATLVLQTSRGLNETYSFKIIKCSFIKRIEHLFNGYNNHLRSQDISIDDIISSLNDISNMSQNITTEGKSIYELLSTTISDVEWNGNTIIVLKNIKITHPYKVPNVIPLERQHNNSLILIKKIIERGWRQIDEDKGLKGG